MRRSCCWRLVAAAAFVPFLFAPRAALSQAGAIWTPNGSMPFERGEIAVAVVNDKVYVISGSSRGVEANAFNQEFDPATGMWRERSLMPSVASHAGAAVINGKIFIVGGFVANVHVGAVNRVFEYDPATDRWRALAPLGAPRGSPVLSRSTERFTRSADVTRSGTPSLHTKSTTPRPTAGPWQRRCRWRAITSAPSLPAGGSTSSAGGRTRPWTIPRATTCTTPPPTAGVRRRRCSHRAARASRFPGWPDCLCGRRMQGSAG